jgi:hypothetical protein
MPPPRCQSQLFVVNQYSDIAMLPFYLRFGRVSIYETYFLKPLNAWNRLFVLAVTIDALQLRNIIQLGKYSLDTVSTSSILISHLQLEFLVSAIGVSRLARLPCIWTVFQVAMMVFSALQVHQTRTALVITPGEICFTARILSLLNSMHCLMKDCFLYL